MGMLELQMESFRIEQNLRNQEFKKKEILNF